jgi:hypothetical protein
MDRPREQFLSRKRRLPEHLTEAFALLLAHKPPPSQRPNRAGTEDVSGRTFLQNALVAGSDGETHQSTKCCNCNRFGHFSNQCPDGGATNAVQLLQVEESSDNCVSAFTFLNVSGDRGPDIVLEQTGPNIIPSTWMLLDSQSTCSVFKDRKLLTNVRDSPCTPRVHTNGGMQRSTKIGTVKFFGFGDVWFNPDSLANTLSMAEVRKVCRITMDTSQEAAIAVHRKDGSLMVFRECQSELCFFDTAATSERINDKTSPGLRSTIVGACQSRILPSVPKPRVTSPHV